MRGRAEVARQAHNLEAVGSIPTPATIFTFRLFRTLQDFPLIPRRLRVFFRHFALDRKRLFYPLLDASDYTNGYTNFRLQRLKSFESGTKLEYARIRIELHRQARVGMPHQKLNFLRIDLLFHQASAESSP